MAFSFAQIHAKQDADKAKAKDLVVSAAEGAGGDFLRFLDAVEKAGVKVQPRWTSNKDTGYAPIHSFHLKPMRFEFETSGMQELDGIDWPWLLGRLDYPHAAKERLRSLALPDSLEWCNVKHAEQRAKGSSKGEESMRQAFEWMYGQPFANVRPDWFVPPGYLHKFELDGYCEPLGLAFEYQGQHHSELLEGSSLQERMRIDAWKRHLVTERGIYFIEVHHYEMPIATMQNAAKLVMGKMYANHIGREHLKKMTDPSAITFRDQNGFKV